MRKNFKLYQKAESKIKGVNGKRKTLPPFPEKGQSYKSAAPTKYKS